MMARRSRKLRMMNVSVRVPSIMGEARKPGAADDGELRHVLLELVLVADLQEHGAREQAVPGLLGDDADGQAVLGIGAGVAILHEDVAALQVALQARQQRAEVFAGEGPVVLAPPDAVFGGLLADHELVGRGARGVLAGVDQHRPRWVRPPSERNTISSYSAAVGRFQ